MSALFSGCLALAYYGLDWAGLLGFIELEMVVRLPDH